MVMAMANLAMATGNIGRDGVGVNPLRGQNNVQGSCDMGSFPHEFPGYRHVSDADGARASSSRCGASRSTPSRGCASRTCSTPRSTAPSRRCSSRARTSPSPTRTPTTSRGARGARPRRRAGPLLERDGEVRARVLPGDVVPREGRHVHQRRAPHQPGPPGRWRRRTASRSGRSSAEIATAMGYPMHWDTRVGDHGRDRGDDPDVLGGLLRPARPGRLGAVAVQRGRRRSGRRSCTSGRSSAARAGSWRRRSSRPTSGPTAASRSS